MASNGSEGTHPRGYTLPAALRRPKKTDTLTGTLVRADHGVTVNGFVDRNGKQIPITQVDARHQAVARGVEACEAIDWGLLSPAVLEAADRVESVPATGQDSAGNGDMRLIMFEIGELRDEFYPFHTMEYFAALFSLWRWKMRNGGWESTGPDPIPNETVADLVRGAFGDRPLIDKLQEATFGDKTGMQWVADLYGLRSILRGAHCFVLDAPTSAILSDFSIAIAPDVDSARQLAVPPFPKTWIEIDNRARIKRTKELGIGLTSTASNIDNLVQRVGWLITTHGDMCCATYCCDLASASGIFVSPMSYWWRMGAPSTPEQDAERIPNAIPFGERGHEARDKSVFGLTSTNVALSDAYMLRAPYMKQTEATLVAHQRAVDAMSETFGELRHIFGFLVALNCSHSGVTATTGEGRKYDGPALTGGGKPLFPLEHKTLTITLAKRTTVEKAVLKATAHIRKRRHEVRGHVRTLHKPNPDGTLRRVPVKSHWRGDERLGKIEKDYKVERS